MRRKALKSASTQLNVSLSSWSPAIGKWRGAPWPYARAVAKTWVVWGLQSSLPCFATKSQAAAVLFWRIAYRNVEARKAQCGDLRTVGAGDRSGLKPSRGHVKRIA